MSMSKSEHNGSISSIVESPPPDEGFYQVERIVDKKIRDGVVYYHIKWRGYPEDENTWEPFDNCRSTMPLIEEFEANLKRVLQKRSRSKSAVGRHKSKSRVCQEAAPVDIGDTSEQLNRLSLDNVTISNNSVPEKDTALSEKQNDLANRRVQIIKQRAPRRRGGNVYRTNTPELDTCYDSCSDHEISTRQINSTVPDAKNSSEKSKLRKCSANQLEIVGALPDITGEGSLIIGVRRKSETEDTVIIKFNSREVAELWPNLYIAFLEHRVVFESM